MYSTIQIITTYILYIHTYVRIYVVRYVLVCMYITTIHKLGGKGKEEGEEVHEQEGRFVNFFFLVGSAPLFNAIEFLYVCVYVLHCTYIQ